MNLILNIESAVAGASVCLADGEQILGIRETGDQKDSAAWLLPAISELLEEHRTPLSRLSAIAVSSGPGSYTGLRVGMATAKGLCYPLGVPLILVNTLQMMAASVRSRPEDLLCPLIDARRMEVFTAVYRKDLSEWLPYQNLVLDEGSFKTVLDAGPVFFFGNGSTKLERILDHPNARFGEVKNGAWDMTTISASKFEAGDFASLAYAEPFYGKDFHSLSQ